MSYLKQQFKLFIHYRLANHSKIPDNNLLLLTHQRAGSTWLQDICRSLPFIDMHPSYFIYGRLGLYGSRYPSNLTLSGLNNHKEGHLIEIRPHEWERIGLFHCKFNHISNLPVFFVEKAHPHFARNRWSSFKKKLLSFDKSTNLKIVILVRDPVQSIESFLNYKKRNPYWYARISNQYLVDFFMDEYRKLYEIFDLFKPMVLHYKDIQNDVHQCVLRVLDYCYDNSFDTNEINQIIEEVIIATDKKVRVDRKNIFFNNAVSSRTEELPSYISNRLPELNQIYNSFNRQV